MVDKTVANSSVKNEVTPRSSESIDKDDSQSSMGMYSPEFKGFKVWNAIFAGNYHDNLPHGKGKLKVDGQIYKGIWNEGRLDHVKTLNKSVGKQVQQDQMKNISILVNETRVYIGEVSDDEPHG
jgi:hypothetical protein